MTTGAVMVKAKSQSEATIQKLVQINQTASSFSVVVVSGIEPPPGTSNTIVLTVEIRDQGGADALVPGDALGASALQHRSVERASDHNRDRVRRGFQPAQR